jgi:hypothetical protein
MAMVKTKQNKKTRKITSVGENLEPSFIGNGNMKSATVENVSSSKIQTCNLHVT